MCHYRPPDLVAALTEDNRSSDVGQGPEPLRNPQPRHPDPKPTAFLDLADQRPQPAQREAVR